ncbi:helix-turn-helix domain-containing protein [Amycolatopsis thailandensis]|uniref:helix-turn-helix domain-containing protein n=1 Tax=Amycolatopsis thailandensis TaxID=589330 RepID=UPI003793B4C9
MSAPSPRARALAAALKKLCDDRGVGIRELARRIDVQHSNVSYWLSSKRIPAIENVATILQELGVVGPERDRILDLAREATSESNWLSSGLPGMSPGLAGVLDCEATANEIVEWSLSAIPGLLQTSAYARAVLSAAREGNGIDSLVMMRLGRQEVITRQKPVKFTALIAEQALHEVFASEEEHVEQLRHVLEMARRPNLTIQIVRSRQGWHSGLAGPFIIYNFPDSPSIIHIEHLSSSAFLYEPRDVEVFQAAAQMVRGKAMSPEASSELIASVIGDMEMR